MKRQGIIPASLHSAHRFASRSAIKKLCRQATLGTAERVQHMTLFACEPGTTVGRAPGVFDCAEADKACTRIRVGRWSQGSLSRSTTRLGSCFGYNIGWPGVCVSQQTVMAKRKHRCLPDQAGVRIGGPVGSTLLMLQLTRCGASLSEVAILRSLRFSKPMKSLRFSRAD